MKMLKAPTAEFERFGALTLSATALHHQIGDFLSKQLDPDESPLEHYDKIAYACEQLAVMIRHVLPEARTTAEKTYEKQHGHKAKGARAQA